MQLSPLSRDQVRNVDQIAIKQFGIPGIVLMENAGRGAAETIHRLAPQGLVTILAGGGNNGGDGYVIARHLQLMGHTVQITSMVDVKTLQGDALINATIAKKSDISISAITDQNQIAASIGSPTIIVDCLLGTGARGELREPYATTVRLANQKPAKLRIAIDIPTGLDCDTGVANDPTFQADHTITFVAEKIGFAKENAQDYLGIIHEVGIGVPLKLLKEVL